MVSAACSRWTVCRTVLVEFLAQARVTRAAAELTELSPCSSQEQSRSSRPLRQSAGSLRERGGHSLKLCSSSSVVTETRPGSVLAWDFIKGNMSSRLSLEEKTVAVSV